LVEHPALKRGREVLDRAEILDMPVLDAQVRGCARLLALAAFLGALVAGLLGRGLRLGRLGSRCRGDWILRFGMERGAVLVVAGVAAPAERESSGGQQCCADGRDRRLRHQTSPLSASGVPVVVFTWRPDFVFIFETRFVNSCGATMKDAMSAEAAPAIQTVLKMPGATESPQRKIMSPTVKPSASSAIRQMGERPWNSWHSRQAVLGRPRVSPKSLRFFSGTTISPALSIIEMSCMKKKNRPVAARSRAPALEIAQAAMPTAPQASRVPSTVQAWFSGPPRSSLMLMFWSDMVLTPSSRPASRGRR